MSESCPNFLRLRNGWREKHPEVQSHLENCADCRQSLLVGAGLEALKVPRRSPATAPGFHLWRARIQERLERAERATVAISAMYLVGFVVVASLVLLASDYYDLLAFPDWFVGLPSWVADGALFFLGAVLLFLTMAGLLRMEEK